MATPRSPFLIYREFISPLYCETIISDLGFLDPDVTPDGKPLKMIRHNDRHEEELYHRVQDIVPEVFEYYGAEYRATEKMWFEYLAEGVQPEPECANSQYLRKKWVRTKDRDFTAFLFLVDYSNEVPFDGEYEVYGGKLEFPQHNFSFSAERGTLVIFPAAPHFIYCNSFVAAGDMFQVKMNFAATRPYIYQPAEFPGDYRSWFAGLL